MNLLLIVDASRVRLSGVGVDVAAPHRGVRPGLANALDDVRRARARAGSRRVPGTASTVAMAVDPASTAGSGGSTHDLEASGVSLESEAGGAGAFEGLGRTSGVGVSLRRAGELLAQSFLPAPVGEALAKALHESESAGEPLRLGVQAQGDLTQLPWEALADPLSGAPLALHPRVTVYRQAPKLAVPEPSRTSQEEYTHGAPSTGPAREVPPLRPGPLRIVVAIAAPSVGGGELLDYESELRAVLAAVQGARAGQAHVRVVPFATTAEIRTVLTGEDVHVLHVSSHGGPGVLHLEDEDGYARAVTAREFFDEAIPPTRVPAVVALAACYTDAPASAQALSFAAELVAAGVPAVIGTETSVTDRYATRVFAQVYAELVRDPVPDVVSAVARARRQVQRELTASTNPRDAAVAGLDEWGVVTVLARQAPTLVLSPYRQRPAPEEQGQREGPKPAVGGLVAREAGEFVGRRAEQRRLPAVLAGEPRSLHGVLLHGIGGIGKTTLGAQLLDRTRQRDPTLRVATIIGATTVDTLLATVAETLRGSTDTLEGGTGTSAGRGRRAREALAAMTKVDLPWQQRWQALSEHVLHTVPLLLVLDNFEDNLRDPRDTRFPEGSEDPAGRAEQVARQGGRQLRDTALAELLTRWLQIPGRSRLLITCRYPIGLPENAHTLLVHHHLGPLTEAEALKLVWSLPRLDALDAADITRLWRDVGGHPRTLEYVDALLEQERIRFADVTSRLEDHARRRLGAQADGWFAHHRTLDKTIAEAVTVAADDILLPDLLAELAHTTGAEQALLGLSVHRQAVDRHALLFHIGGDQHDPRLGDVPAGSVDDSTPPDQPLAPSSVMRETHERVDGIVSALVTSSLLSLEWRATNEATPVLALFVHRWTATELIRRWRDDGRADELRAAHLRAAKYWRWHAEQWPQDPNVRVAELLEARHHLLEAGASAEAIDLAAEISTELDQWRAWDKLTPLVLETLDQLPPGDGRRPHWLLTRGFLAYWMGEYPEAGRFYREALEGAEELGDRVLAANAHYDSGDLAQAQGNYPEAERCYRQAVKNFADLGDRTGVAKTHRALGTLALGRGNYPGAERCYRQALKGFEESGDRAGAASAHHGMGSLAQRRGDYSGAEGWYRQALEGFEQLGDRDGVVQVQFSLGSLAMERGSYPDAEDCFQKALKLFEELRDLIGAARTHHALALLGQARGDYSAAQRSEREALELYEKVGDRGRATSARRELGTLAQVQGDYCEAERRLWEALNVYEGLGDRIGAAGVRHSLGGLALARADHLEAERCYRQALELYEGLGDRAGAAFAHHSLGSLAFVRAEYGEAERCFHKALDMFEKVKYGAAAAGAHRTLGTLAQMRGDYRGAGRCYRQALKIYEGLGNHAGAAYAYHALAALAQAQGKYTEAERHFLKALKAFQMVGHRAGVADAYHDLGTLAQARGDYPEARRCHWRALEIFQELGNRDRVAAAHEALKKLS